MTQAVSQKLDAARFWREQGDEAGSLRRVCDAVEHVDARLARLERAFSQTLSTLESLAPLVSRLEARLDSLDEAVFESMAEGDASQASDSQAVDERLEHVEQRLELVRWRQTRQDRAEGQRSQALSKTLSGFARRLCELESALSLAQGETTTSSRAVVVLDSPALPEPEQGDDVEPFEAVMGDDELAALGERELY